MIDAICKEIELQKEYLNGAKIETIYFGGGTPSLLDLADFELIFNAIAKHHSLSGVKEITIEANPDDLNLVKLKELKTTLINRFSIGIQSFYDDDLKFINRAHTSSEAENCVKLTQDSGFENITIDLIFGIPTLTNEKWKSNIEKALSLDIPHLSCYALTIEEKTVFGNWLKKGKINVSDDDTVNNQFELLMNLSAKAGFEQYEISNYAKENYRAVHNTNYWKGIKYLGIGPGAHSFDGVSRQYNIANNPQYIQSINEGRLNFDKEILTKANQLNEYIMTSLRTSWGCDLNFINKIYSVDLMNLNKNYIQQAIISGLLIIENNYLYLTKKGKLISDSISSQLFV